MGVLTVFLDKITRLRDEDGLGKSDPYVTFELEQDNWFLDKAMGMFTSSKKKNECNPVYGETFTFEDVSNLDNMKLHVKVWDDDYGRDDSLGGCTFNLEKMDLSGGDPVSVHKVVDNKRGEGWFSRKAKIYLTLSYEE